MCYVGKVNNIKKDKIVKLETIWTRKGEDTWYNLCKTLSFLRVYGFSLVLLVDIWLQWLPYYAWQSSCGSSALFLTAAAQNLLCIKFAESLGVNVSAKWFTWFKAASLPALVSLLCTPFVIYKIFPPETKHTPDAPVMATRKLEEMGPVTMNEWIMLGTMLVTVALWISG